MSQRPSRATLQRHLEEALWREALARHAIDCLRAQIDEPLDKQLEIDADEAELKYRLARAAHVRGQHE